MNKQSVELPQSLPGKIVLLHSGYGGGQYVGRIVDIEPSNNPKRALPLLILDSSTKRYQPRDSTYLGHLSRDDICYWQEDPDTHVLPLKEKDRLYLVGDSADLRPFQESREPINPENPEHVKKLAGKESLELLYGGSELLMVI